VSRCNSFESNFFAVVSQGTVRKVTVQQSLKGKRRKYKAWKSWDGGGGLYMSRHAFCKLSVTNKWASMRLGGRHGGRRHGGRRHSRRRHGGRRQRVILSG
jgi:hypothetical protein